MPPRFLFVVYHSKCLFFCHIASLFCLSFEWIVSEDFIQNVDQNSERGRERGGGGQNQKALVFFHTYFEVIVLVWVLVDVCNWNTTAFWRFHYFETWISRNLNNTRVTSQQKLVTFSLVTWDPCRSKRFSNKLTVWLIFWIFMIFFRRLCKGFRNCLYIFYLFSIFVCIPFS